MWQRFTERARRVVFYAQEEAQRFGEGYVSTEHLLLGLLREEDAVACRLLAGIGVNIHKIRTEVEKQLFRADGRPSQDMTLTPRGKRVIDLAYDEARNLNNNYIGTEHLLLGLVREGDGLAGRVLENMGLEIERLRRAVLAMQEGEDLGRVVVPPASHPEPPWSGYSPAAIALLVAATSTAMGRNHGLVYPAHLIEALLQAPDAPWELLQRLGVDREALTNAVRRVLEGAPEASRLEFGLAPLTRSALRAAWNECVDAGAAVVEPTHVLLGLAGVECLSELGFKADLDAGRAFLNE